MDHSDDSLSIASPIHSPSGANPSPFKSKKDAREAKQAFDARKHGLAVTFLARLDAEVAYGQIGELTASTGGVKIKWSKKLNSTAGKANWKREGITYHNDDGTVTKHYEHFANIELAEKVIDNEHRLYETMAHEFCHLTTYMISKVTKSAHGIDFQVWYVHLPVIFRLMH
jgi:SprT-like family